MRAWPGCVVACAAVGLTAAAVAAPQALPPEAVRALQSAGVPAEALSVVVLDAAGRRLLQWNETKPVNPASLMKLVTTAAALERLGPAWNWSTPVWLTGPVNQGVLEGSLVIKGSGDPRLVPERLWLMLRRVQQLGVREIRGDIVLDSSAFAVPEVSPADFDGEPLRPYNVRPAALLFNFRAVTYTFVPDAAAGVARVLAEPALAGTLVDTTVPLAAGPCDDWRAALKPSFETGRTRFAGAFPLACGETAWPVADPQPATYEARLIEALWREMGGALHGRAREGLAPADARPAFELRSPALAEVVRDINKFSNNVMAQQLFLTLAREAQPGRPATPDAARELLLRWLAERSGPLADDVLLDNGSGLSRSTRLSAQRLAAVLLYMLDSPWMSELMSSLPISGVDGTMRRSRTPPGRAHLKTGSLKDVSGVAGYALSGGGRRYVVVAIVNHPQAGAARPALDALVRWALRDAPAHRVSSEP
ncbi:MAG: D-alanyl-D-alanine carboxypeptidase/D-alanyl-D-alanine-endopeptidase [Rubrivivax sp.]|nr:D-alanyl-D-alanine carboxypeptidase/D-alanyl-D-alanine-endopeptidase [Rubrivivax sp.]